MAIREEKLHEFALRTLRAQKFTDLYRAQENRRVLEEAKSFNIAPNEILCYVMNNEQALSKELEPKSAG